MFLVISETKQQPLLSGGGSGLACTWAESNSHWDLQITSGNIATMLHEVAPHKWHVQDSNSVLFDDKMDIFHY